MAWRMFRRNTVSGVEARAGFLDRPVLTVLVISTILAVIAFVIVFAGVR